VKVSESVRIGVWVTAQGFDFDRARTLPIRYG
jgi:hypothetical protein